MSIEELSMGINLVSTTIATLQKLKEFIPPSKRSQVVENLKEAEENFKKAEAEIAKGFNYQLCRRHFPPGIMLEIGPFKSKCNMCGNVEDLDP